jgi:hypothetical protein
MRDWYSAAELAGVPGMPETRSGVIRAAKKGGWTSRKRTGRGGGRDYHRDSLPPETQAALRERETAAVVRELVAAAPVPAELAEPEPDAASEDASASAIDPEEARRARKAEGMRRFTALPKDAPKRQRAKAREWLVLRYLELARDPEQVLSKCAARERLCEQVNSASIDVPAAVLRYLPRYQSRRALDEATLQRWELAYHNDGVWGLTDGYGNRKGGGLIETQPEVLKIVLGQIVATPQITGKDIHQLLLAKAGLGELPQDIRLPAQRTLHQFLGQWRAQNRELWTLLTNPGRHKNHFQVAFGSHHASVHRLNQVWEMDSTPGDWLLSDGRHTVIGCIDLYSRRITLLVSKNSTAMAVGQCLRRSILGWGVPEMVRTDNGKDYVSDFIVSALQALEIRQELCIPFKSEQKGTIERALKTVCYGIAKLLPGYIGHNVAEREAIRSRQTFAERIMTPGDAVEVAMSAADLQRILDEWADAIYHQDPHRGEGMNGLSPLAKAASWSGAIRTVDERALDHLLLPLEGVRTVGKKGIRWDNRTYISATLGRYIGEQVTIRYDEADLGRIYVYGEDRFLCTAECPEMTGISRAEVTMAAQAEQRKWLKERSAELREFKKQQSKNTPEIVLKHRAKKDGKLVEFPHQTTAHQTPMLAAAAAAAEAAQAASAPDMRQDTPEQLAAKAELAKEMDAARAAQQAERQPAGLSAANVHVMPATPKARYMRWLRIDNERIRGDRHHSAEDVRWWESYPRSPEWRTQHMLAEDHPEAYDLFAGAAD